MASRQVRGRIRKPKIQQAFAATSKQGWARAQKTLAAALILLALGAVTLVMPYLAAAPAQARDWQAKDKHKKKDSTESSAAAAAGKPAPNNLMGLPATDLTTDEAIAHALNRLGFGPRPGDVDRVKQMGLAKWIDRQLHPESIDDSAMDARLQRFPTLTMSSETLLTKFPRPQIAARREGVTPEEYRKQQQEKLQAARQAADGNEQASAQQEMARGGQQAGIKQGNGQGNAQDDAAMNMPGMPASGGDKTANGPENGAGNPAANGPANQMMNYEQLQTPQRIIAELSMAKVDRAIYSERQLDEQMADFWFNHFNVFAGKGQDRWLLTSYERDAIRPHAMGKFRDLLAATAKSPAMLFYLDNWQSVDPQAFKRMQQEQAARRGMRGAFGRGRFGFPAGMPGPNVGPGQGPGQGQAQAQAKKNQDRGLNENYGRELMELHTLGVDAGYTQQDVLEVAKCFTGWTIRTPQRAPEFWFDERLHDPNPKTVLGHRINGGGIKDGEEVLDLLARDPHTAHHLSYEIAQYFVADNPPAALVDRMAQTLPANRWRHSRGAAHHDLFAGVLVSRSVSRKNQDAVRGSSLRRPRRRRRRGDTPATRAVDRAHRRAAVPVPAADRILGQSGSVGQYRRAAQPDELFAGPYEQPAARRDRRCRVASWKRRQCCKRYRLRECYGRPKRNGRRECYRAAARIPAKNPAINLNGPSPSCSPEKCLPRRARRSKRR